MNDDILAQFIGHWNMDDSAPLQAFKDAGYFVAAGGWVVYVGKDLE